MKVVALYRYPVKAMAGEPLTSVQLGWAGLEGDRRYAFVRSEDRSDFPWLTIRQVPALTTYVAKDGVVRTPAGRELAVDSQELAAELAAAYGRPVHLLRSSRGLFDAFPVSVISLQTVAAVSELVGRELEPLRFRPNIVIDVPGAVFPEEAWIGRGLQVGDARIRLDVRDERCMVINFDPHTAERDPAVLRAVARHRQTCVAVYGSCVEPGEIRVGDSVTAARSGDGA
ncbi:MAG TPA: MOSC domain-containing protein [Solirubrobacter sp.]|nr:MOSC domain-containing protein [Solirubrobacter sp.]